MKEKIKLRNERKEALSAVYHLCILFALAGATAFQLAQKSWIFGAIFAIVTILKGYYLFGSKDEPEFPMKK